jgi:2-oxoglutarate dehydrogenase E1 component
MSHVPKPKKFVFVSTLASERFRNSKNYKIACAENRRKPKKSFLADFCKIINFLSRRMLSSARNLFTKKARTSKNISRLFGSQHDNFMNGTNSVYTEQMYD